MVLMSKNLSAKTLRKDSGHFCGKYGVLTLRQVIEHSCLAKEDQNPCHRLMRVEGTPDLAHLLRELEGLKKNKMRA